MFIGFVLNIDYQYKVYFLLNKIRILNTAHVIFNEDIKGFLIAKWNVSLNYDWPIMEDKDGLLKHKDLVGI